MFGNVTALEGLHVLMRPGILTDAPSHPISCLARNHFNTEKICQPPHRVITLHPKLGLGRGSSGLRK